MTRGADTHAAPSLLASQWFLTNVQLVNWGTFCGYHHLRIRDDKGGPSKVLMITGESGTGKSTLFDAKTAVLMKGTARFNVASNQTTGRARGSRERNLYSYVMGKQDDEYDPSTGEARESYLRSTSNSNWSVVMLTFSCTTGETLCVARLYYVTAHATGNPDAWFLTADRELDPRDLKDYASTKFSKPVLESAFPGATVYDGQEKFLREVYRRLGIGRDGDGDSAMKLQERIQAGTTITDVDALFKTLVIDEPSTYELAEEACESFANYEATWEEMDRARRKMADLAGIREQHEELEGLTSEVGLIGSCRPGEDGPLALWVTTRGSEILSAYAQESDERVKELDGRIAGKEGEIANRKAELERVRKRAYDCGADAIDSLRKSIEEGESRLRGAREARDRLSGFLDDVGRALPSDSDSFDTLTKEAEEFLATYDERKRQIDEARVTDMVNARDLEAEEKALKEQLAFYREHPVNISRRMVEDRRRISEATGIPEDQLPYAAELMDLKESEDEWRVAANVGFHGIATLMLVNAARLQDFSVKINSLKLNHRITFQGVHPKEYRPSAGAAGTLSSKLVFKEGSPFSAWVADKVRESARDYTCVDRPEDLGGDGQQITREGQTRRGKGGAHGHSRNSLIIGFTNDKRVAELEAEVAQVEEELRAIRDGLRRADADLAALDRRRDAARHILDLRWEVVDVDSCQRRLDALRAELARLERDESLAQLISLRDDLIRKVEGLNQELGVLKSDRESVSSVALAAHEAASRSESEAEALVGQGISVLDDQAELISGYVKSTEDTLRGSDQDLRSIAKGYENGTIGKAIARSLLTRKREAESRVREKTEALEKTFRGFKERWLEFDDPIGTDIQSYPDYERILDGLESEQMDLHIEDWLIETLRRTGSALVPLSRAYTSDLKSIHRRMEPINAIMGQFEFGPDGGELAIKVSNTAPKFVADFRRELADWAQLATVGSFDDPDGQHQKLRAFMSRLKEACQQGDRGPLNTKRLVHVKVVASYPDKPGLADKSFESLGAKSGGETQELIAFILGAALLFCLGDNGQALPSFAPVFLDEAFIKADERFTRRAIEVLIGLGFQVVIAVPTSKVQAVEPVADEFVCVTKRPSDNHSFINEMTGVRPDA